MHCIAAFPSLFVCASSERWHACAFRWTSGLIVCDLRLAGCLLSWITFWHSSLLSQTLQYLRLRVDGGPNDKASLTISRQKQGGERGKLNCQREKRRERRSGGEREKGGTVGSGGDPILQNGARHNLFIWCPSGSTFPLSQCSADLPPSVSPSFSLPSLIFHFTFLLMFTHHSFPSIVYTMFINWMCDMIVLSL